MENLPPTEPVVPQPDQQMPQPPSVITQNQQASVTIEQQPSVPNSTQEVPTTKSGNKNPLLFAVFGFLLLILIGISGFFFFKERTFTESIPSAGIETEYGYTLDIPPYLDASPAAVIVDKTQGWSRYDNYELGYSFKHPEEDPYQAISCTPFFLDGKQVGEFKYIFFDSASITNQTEFEKVCMPEYGNPYVELTHQSTEPTCFGSTQKIAMADITATQCSGKTNSDSSTTASTSLFIPAKEKFIIIEASSKEYVPLLQNIVETFAFETQEPVETLDDTP